MQRKWYNPKKSVIKKQGLVLHYDYKPVIYGNKENIEFLIDNYFKERKKKDYIIKKSNGVYTLCVKTEYYQKREGL